MISLADHLLRTGCRSALLLLLLASCHDATGPAAGTRTPPAPQFAAASSAGGVYTAIDLGTLGGNISQATDVNEAGQVVGNSSLAGGKTHAFLWAKGVMIDLGTLGGNSSAAVAVNDANPVQVVGSSSTATGDLHAFLWDPVNGMTFLGPMSAVAVNEAGQVVGDGQSASGQHHAFLWDPVNGMTDLGTLPGGSRSFGVAVNDANPVQVVGVSTITPFREDDHAFIWDPVNGMTDLGTLGFSSEAVDVNDSGQVTGQSLLAEFGEEFRAFLWDNGVMTDLGVWASRVARRR